MKKIIASLLACAFLVGCGGPLGEATEEITQVVDVDTDPTVVSIEPTATTAPTPSPTPTLSAEEQLQAAFVEGGSELCRNAFLPDPEHTWDRRASLPAVALVNVEYEEDAWALSDFMSIPEDIDQAQTIVCILQTRIYKGTYIPAGGSAYQHQWDIWLVTWPDGALIGSRTYLGGSPPSTKTGPGDRYGSSPEEEALAWVEGALSEPLAALDAYLHSLAYIEERASLLTNFKRAVHEIDAVTGEQLGAFDFSLHASRVTYSPDGNLAAASLCTEFEDASCTSAEVEVRSVTTGEKVFTLRGDPEYPLILSLAFSPDGRTLLTGHSGTIEGTTREQIWRWNMSNGRGTVLLEGEAGHVYELRISPNGDTLAANINVGIRLLEVRNGEQFSAVAQKGDWPSFEFSPDGSMLAVAYCEEIEATRCVLGGIMLWDLTAEAEKVSWTAAESEIHSMAFSPDGTILASGACSQLRIALTNQNEPIELCTAADISLWSTADGSLIRTFGGHTIDVVGLAFSPDGTQLFSAGYDGTIRLWELE